MVMCDKLEIPRGLRARCRLKRAGGNTFWHALSLIRSAFLGPSLCHSLVPPHFPHSVRLCLCFRCLDFIPFHSVITSKVFMMSFCALTVCHFDTPAQTLTAQQHTSCLTLFTASLSDLPLYHTAVTPIVGGGEAAICSQASSHDTQQYTVGYESQLIAPLI